MTRQTIVLYPSPPTGHLMSMVELGKSIIERHPSFSITVLVTTPPFHLGTVGPYIDHVSKTTPSITFHYLPTIPLSSIPDIKKEGVLIDLLLLNNIHVHEALQTISSTSRIPAFIMDIFCSSLQIVDQMNIPIFYFFTSGLCFLSVILHLPTIYKSTKESFKDMKNTFIDFPGLPPISSSVIIKSKLDRTDRMYECFDYFYTNFPNSKGIIVNSFDSLEPQTLEAIKDGQCVPDGPTPPIYCIGPLIASNDQTSGGGGGGDGLKQPCLEWLDKQPSKSVVFLCFGSLGLLSEGQLKEIAIGLEKSGHRFLWVVRYPDGDLDAILPDGFLESTKERGLILKSWVPQVEILSKKSVGGFVTHCGWNSTLEALRAGKAMVAWPLYAEQRINKVILVEEMKVALSMEEGEDGCVSAEEVEKKVRWLMESKEGSLIRENVPKLSDEAKAALTEGGSSVKALSDLAELWKL